MARIFAPIVPPNDPRLCQPWLNRELRRLSFAVQQGQRGMAAVTRGELPDASGTPIVDTSLFFYKPGLPNNQLAYGGTTNSGTLTLSSTRASTKGKIFLGDALTSAFDEANGRLGIGTASPAATLHIIGSSAGGAATLTTSSDLANNWAGPYTGGGTPIGGTSAAALSSNDGTTSWMAIQTSPGNGTNPQRNGLNGTVQPNSSYAVSLSIFTLSTPIGVGSLFVSLIDSAGNQWRVTIDMAGLTSTPTTYNTTIVTSGSPYATGGTANSLNLEGSIGGGADTGKYICVSYVQAVGGGIDIMLARTSGGTTALRIDPSGNVGVRTGTDSLSALQTIGQSTADASTVRLSILGHTAQTVDLVSITPGISGTTAMIVNLRGTLSAGRIGTGIRFTDDNATPASAKLLALSLTSITTGTTRTWTAQDASGTVAFISALLDGVNNSDTLAGAVTRGDLIYGNATPKWARFAKGAAGSVVGYDANDVVVITPSGLATRVQFEWRANGPYQTGTEVDGQLRIPTAFTISSVRLYRKTAGSSGSTIVDLNKNGTTMFTTQANRPTVTAAGGNNQASSGTQPDVTAVAAGDVLSIDIDQIEGGTPSDFVLIIEGA